MLIEVHLLESAELFRDLPDLLLLTGLLYLDAGGVPTNVIRHLRFDTGSRLIEQDRAQKKWKDMSSPEEQLTVSAARHMLTLMCQKSLRHLR
jgi:hypothetical protein